MSGLRLQLSTLYDTNNETNKVDHFKVKLRLPLVHHVGFSIKSDGEVDHDFGGKDCCEDGGEENFW